MKIILSIIEKRTGITERLTFDLPRPFSPSELQQASSVLSSSSAYNNASLRVTGFEVIN